MRIRFLAGTLGQGGAERQLYYQLRALAGLGEDVGLLTLRPSEFWEAPLRALGIAVRCVGRRSSRLLRLCAITRALRRDHPDIVQSAHFFTNLYVAGAARMLGCREVCAIRGRTTIAVRNHGWLGTLSLKAPRLLAANSRNAIREARGLGVPERRLYFLPNVVDTAHFRPHPDPQGDICRVLAVGRLAPEKRFDRLLEVLATARARTRVQLRLTLAGAGPMERRLRSQAADLGLGPVAIRFRGAVDDPAQLFRCADALVLTSDHEGTPNSVLEAMASGLPVVATAVGGVPDLVREGRTGFVRAPEDREGLADALVMLAEDPVRREEMGERGRAFIERYHALDRLPGVLEKLYRTALA